MKLNRDQVYSSKYSLGKAKEAEQALKKLKSDLEYVLLSGSEVWGFRGIRVFKKDPEEKSDLIDYRPEVKVVYDMLADEFNYTGIESGDHTPIALKKFPFLSLPGSTKKDPLLNEVAFLFNHIYRSLAQIQEFKAAPSAEASMKVEIVIEDLMLAVVRSNLVQLVKERTIAEKISDVFKEFITNIKQFFEEHFDDAQTTILKRKKHFETTHTMYNTKKAEREAEQVEDVPPVQKPSKP